MLEAETAAEEAIFPSGRTKGTCRVCLEENTECVFLSECCLECQSDAAEELLTYADCYMEVTNIEIDLLAVDTPQQLCINCCAYLCISYNFLKRAKDTEKFLNSAQEKNKKQKQHIPTLETVIDEEETEKEYEIDNHVELEALQGFKIAELDDENQLIEVEKEEIIDCSDYTDEMYEEFSPISEAIIPAPESTTNKEIVICTICRRRFEPTKYPVHFRKVHSAAPNGFQCPKCPKSYGYRYKLKLHFDVQHGVRQKTVPCPQCGKMFYTNKLLKTHLISHGSNDIHYCKECGKGFVRLAGLKRHMVMHAGGKEGCSECGKRFPNPAELRIHMLSHTKELPHLCAICGQGFRRRGSLSYHIRKHRGEKYTCKHCQRNFLCLSSLRIHEYKHVGLPFKCPRCELGYETRGNLERHMVDVHKASITVKELKKVYSAVKNTRLQ